MSANQQKNSSSSSKKWTEKPWTLAKNCAVDIAWQKRLKGLNRNRTPAPKKRERERTRDAREHFNNLFEMLFQFSMVDHVNVTKERTSTMIQPLTLHMNLIWKMVGKIKNQQPTTTTVRKQRKNKRETKLRLNKHISPEHECISEHQRRWDKWSFWIK